ncbi:hypothetical protein ACVWW6_006020 [Bradyrhizobium sp. USDA 3311]
MTDNLPEPEDWGPPKASEGHALEVARIVTDAHTFIVPLIWFGVALLFWLGMRFAFAPSARHLRRRFGRWIAGD